jgi:hypothetical protein
MSPNLLSENGGSCERHSIGMVSCSKYHEDGLNLMNVMKKECSGRARRMKMSSRNYRSHGKLVKTNGGEVVAIAQTSAWASRMAACLRECINTGTAELERKHRIRPPCEPSTNTLYDNLVTKLENSDGC